jgi:ATP-binding cassette subfamily F protein uup
MEGEGHVGEYVGGYSDWVRQRPVASVAVQSQAKSSPMPVASTVAATAEPKRKLSFKDARELEQAPARIESLEAEQAELGARLSEPSFYKRTAAEQAKVHARLAALAAELEADARWYALEALRDGA